MRKVFLDDLPRWGKGNRINWSESVGYSVKFVYDDVVGEIKIVRYYNSYKLLVQYLNKEVDIVIDNFKKGKLSKVLWMTTPEFKIDIGTHFQDGKRDLIIIGREYKEKEHKPNKKGKIYNVNQKWYEYKCNLCGYNGWKIESSILNGCGCPFCVNQIVIEGKNDIPTTNPELVKYFKGGYNIAKLYTKGSGKKVEVICYICGKTRFISVNTIKENLVCEDCKSIVISKSKEFCKIEDSFEMNDKYNKLKYWNYDKNIKLPHEVYKGSTEKFWFVCDNEHSFKAGLAYINGKRATWCPHCANLLKESKMASILKQIVKREFPNSVWEYDIGFKGIKGGASKYDIYIPEVNLIIECQSEYHDKKRSFDKFKREFAINKGYYYIDVDYRDFDLLQAVQLFFPYIKEIPDYIIHTKNVRVDWDIEQAQKLLNETNLNQKEIAEKIGASNKSFYDKVHRNILDVPLDKRIYVAVVQIDFDGNFVRKHSKANHFKQYGFNTPDICQCCKGYQKTHKGYIFMYESKYNAIKNSDGSVNLKEDYEKIYKNANKKKVLQIDLAGNIVSEYGSISEVERKTGFLTSNISACCSGVSKTSNGYVWVYKSDYRQNKDYNNNIINLAKPKLFRKGVVCIDVVNFNYQIYESAREVERKIGLDYRTVSYKCRKKYNNKDMNIWMFKEDFDIIYENKPLLIDIIDNFKMNKYHL